MLIMGCPLASFAQAPLSSGPVECMIEPAQVVEVRSPVVGILQQVHVRRGEIVKKDQVLVSIESSVERSAAEAARFRAEADGQVLLARNKVDAASEKVRRTTELAKKGFVSSQASDDATTELRLAESELKSAQENATLAKLEYRQSQHALGRRVLKSPFDGVVMDRYLHPGALVDGADSQKPILKIAQTDPLAVQAILPFQLFPEVQLGQPVTVVPEPPFDQPITAKIRTKDRVIDAATGTFGIVSELSNPEQALPGGIRCTLTLTPPVVSAK